MALDPQLIAIQLERQRQLSSACATHSHMVPTGSNTSISDSGWTPDDDMLVNDNLRVIYCPVGKAGTRSWKYVLLRAVGSKVSMKEADNRHKLSLHYQQLRDYVTDLLGVETRLESYYKFLVVREPMERFMSAYNYLFHTSSYYQMNHGRDIIRRYRPNASETSLQKGRDVQLVEFARYVLDEFRAGNVLDRHWRPQYLLCHPCHIRYNYIGHLETMEADKDAILKQLGVTERILVPRKKPKRTNSGLVRRAFNQLPADIIKQLLELYARDYEIFGYKMDEQLLGNVGFKFKEAKAASPTVTST